VFDLVNIKIQILNIILEKNIYYTIYWKGLAYVYDSPGQYLNLQIFF